MRLTIGLCSLIVVLGTGCSSDGSNRSEDSLPSTPFSETYELEDLNPAGEVEYWEVRQGPHVGEDLSQFNVRERYGNRDSLDDAQRELLQSSTSQTGFAVGCLPGHCPIYAAAITGYDVRTLDSQESLAEFFGGIDTEAELFIYLSYISSYALSTHPLTYEKVDEGFLVVLQWDSLCLNRGRDLVKVYPDGTVEKIHELDRETYDVCV